MPSAGLRAVLGYGAVDQWLMVFARRHPYLAHMINRTVERVERRTSPARLPRELRFASHVKSQVMRVTGPDAFGAAIHEAVLELGMRHRELDEEQLEVLAQRDALVDYTFLGVRHYGDWDDDTPLYARQDGDLSVH